MKNEDDKKILSLMKYLKLPENFNLVSLFGLTENTHKDLQHFMYNTLPDPLKRFTFRAENTWQISQNVNTLVNNLPKVTQCMSIINFAIQSSQLNTIIKCWTNCYKINITNCSIIYNKPYNFITQTPYKTTILSFYGTGRKDKSNWDKNK